MPSRLPCPHPPALKPTHSITADIGREHNTWMDRRWGASGARIPFTCELLFIPPNTLNQKEELTGKVMRPEDVVEWFKK